MSKASKKKYASLKDNKIKEAVEMLLSWNFTSKKWEKLIPYLAQYFKDNLISFESTCLLLSEVVDISQYETKIKEIYDETGFPYLQSDLVEIIGQDKFGKLSEIVTVEDYSNKIWIGEIDDKTYISINMGLKQIFQVKRTTKKDGEDIFTPIIEAVPSELVVYDSAITDQPRNFKITWESRFSKRKFIVTGEGVGANISEIRDYLIEAGYSHNAKFVGNVVACMVNTLIEEGFAKIRTDIDNLGVYYNHKSESVLVVKADYTEPTESEMLEAIDVLNEIVEFYQGNEDVLASVFKWALMSIFSYAMKQVGNKLPYLYLKGTSQSGKTTLGKIALYIYGEPNSDVSIGGSSFNTEFRIGNHLSQDCTARLVNEPAAVFNRDDPKELIKVCVESITARKVKGKVYPAFSPVIFTANQYLPDDDALLNRMYVLTFTYNQRKTDDEKKEFKKFHIDSPSISCLKLLNVFGRFAIREVVADPSLLFDDWQTTADFILDEFFTVALTDKPKWLELWSESESIGDYDDNQTEEIRSFLISEFNKARRNVTIRDEYGNQKGSTLDVDEASESMDFENIIWTIINERMIPWAIPHNGRGNERNVCLTQTLKKELKRHMDYSNDLKSIGELLDWQYGSVRFGNSVKAVIKVPFDDFINFMYPSIGDIDD